MLVSWMLALVAAFFIRQLHESVAMSEGTTPREEPLLAYMEEEDEEEAQHRRGEGRGRVALIHE